MFPILWASSGRLTYRGAITGYYRSNGPQLRRTQRLWTVFSAPLGHSVASVSSRNTPGCPGWASRGAVYRLPILAACTGHLSYPLNHCAVPVGCSAVQPSQHSLQCPAHYAPRASALFEVPCPAPSAPGPIRAPDFLSMLHLAALHLSPRSGLAAVAQALLLVPRRTSSVTKFPFPLSFSLHLLPSTSQHLLLPLTSALHLHSPSLPRPPASSTTKAAPPSISPRPRPLVPKQLFARLDLPSLPRRRAPG